MRSAATETGNRPGLEELRRRARAAFPPEEVEQSVAARFEKQAARYADRVAIQGRKVQYTYAGLDAAANRIAAAVLAELPAGVGRVALLFEQGPAALAAMLGVLKSGHAYVPLDPYHPAARSAYLIDDAAAGLVLTDGHHADQARELAAGRRVLDLDALPPDAGHGVARPEISPDTMVYILYTSGSTGRPKGVVQTQRNLLHFIRSYSTSLGIGPGDRLSLLYSLSFSAALMDIYGALLTGAAVHPFDVKHEGVAPLADWLTSQRINVYHSVPTVFRNFIDLLPPGKAFPDLRVIDLGGEPVYRRDVDGIWGHFPPDCVVVNHLAFTEASVAAQFFAGPRTKIATATVPAGRPADSVEIRVVDEDGRDAAAGEAGEVVVQSRYLSPGYWGQEDLTRAAFRVGPDGRRGYHTGDLGRWGPEGLLEHLGRKDARVKIRGHSVEVAEVEDALLGHGSIKEAAVVAREHPSGDLCLFAYLVLAACPMPTAGDLRRHLEKTLPGYMIPSDFVFLDALPLTATGKVDRRALPAPDATRPELAAEYVAPRSPLEQELADLAAAALGLDKVGVHDNFFDLGGHSILILRLVARIEQRLGVLPPVAAVLRHPTVVQLAAYIEGGSEAGPARPPLFCLNYGPTLSRYLGDQEVVAVSLPSQDVTPCSRIEELAAVVAAKVRAVQPQGPYHLLGYCFQGIVAIEAARQLEQAGQRVAFLGLIECVPFARLRKLEGPPLGRRFLGHLPRLGRMKARHWPGYVLGRAGTLLRLIQWRLFPATRARGVQDWGPALHRSIYAYRPSSFPERVTLFFACDNPQEEMAAVRAEWEKQGIQELQWVTVPGGHFTLWHEPHVAALGELLRADVALASQPEPLTPAAGSARTSSTPGPSPAAGCRSA
jgi:amino acid adenylation domain-containing protein